MALGQSSVPSNNNSNAGETVNPSPNHPTQEIKIIPVPEQLVVRPALMDPFPHAAKLFINNVVSPQHHQHHHSEEQQQPSPQHQHQEDQGSSQNEQHQPSPTGVTHQDDDHLTPGTQFPLCTHVEIPYANVDLITNTHPRSNN